MKKVIFILFAILAGYHTQGQHVDYTQYFYNYYFLNPAYAGTESGHHVETIFRTGFSGNTQSPFRKMAVGYHTASDSGNFGYGASYYYDKDYFQLPTMGINLNFAYHYPWSEDVSIGIGGALSINRHGIQLTGQYDTIGFVSGDYEKYYPSLHFGVLLNSHDRFYAGATLLNVSQPQIQVGPFPSHTAYRIFMLMVAYRKQIQEQMEVVPSLMIRQGVGGSNMGLDLNVQVTLLDDIFAGLGIGSQVLKFYPNLITGQVNCDNCFIGPYYFQNTMASGMIGLRFKDNYRFLISYDYPFKQVGVFNNGFFEASLSIDWEK